MSPQRLWAALAGLLSCTAVLAVSACDELPEIRPNECGNTVVEGWEACDTFGRETSAIGGETLCAQAGTDNQCLYVHDEDHACPHGYGAGLDGVCRRPAWQFVDENVRLPSSGLSTRALDLNADGIDDLLLETPLTTEALGYLFGRGGGQPEPFTVSTPGSLVPLAVGRLTADDRPDVVIPAVGGLRVLLNEVGPELVSKAFAPLRVQEPSRLFAVPTSVFLYNDPLSLDDDALIQNLSNKHVEGRITGTAAEGLQFLYVQVDTGEEIEVAHLPGYGLEDLTAVVSADFDPEMVYFVVPVHNDEIAVGLRGDDAQDDRVVLLELHGDPALRDESELDHFGPTQRRLVGGPYATTRTDGTSYLTHTEQATNGQLFLRISRIEGGDLVLQPEEFPLLTPSELASPDRDELARRAIPLAVGLQEYGPLLALITIDQNSIKVASATCTDELCGLQLAAKESYFPWTHATIDVASGVAVAGSDIAGGLDILRLDPQSQTVNPARNVPTNKPTRQITVGDFDGDGINDFLFLARSEEQASCEDDAELFILWGRPAGHPDEVERVGNLSGMSQVAVGRLLRLADYDGVHDFALLTECSPDTPQRAGIFFGSTTRQIECPLPLLDELPAFTSEGEETVIYNQGLVPVAIAPLELDAAQQTHDNLLALTVYDGDLQLRLFPSDEEADFGESVYSSVTQAPADDNVTVALITAASLGTGDLDGDGNVDVLVWAFDDTSVSADSVTPVVFVGRGDGMGGFSFGAPTPASPYALRQEYAESALFLIESAVAMADLNGDQRKDIVATMSSGELFQPYVLLQGEDGTFSEASLVAVDGAGATLPAPELGAFWVTGDPTFPLAVASALGALLCDDTLTCRPIAPEAPRSYAVALGDFDGDGVDDLASFEAQETVIYRGKSVEELVQQEQP